MPSVRTSFDPRVRVVARTASLPCRPVSAPEVPDYLLALLLGSGAGAALLLAASLAMLLST